MNQEPPISVVVSYSKLVCPVLVNKCIRNISDLFVNLKENAMCSKRGVYNFYCFVYKAWLSIL